jgi:hypothetical protein
LSVAELEQQFAEPGTLIEVHFNNLKSARLGVCVANDRLRLD